MAILPRCICGGHAGPSRACRAVLFAQLVHDPSPWPDRIPTETEQEAERKRLHEIIAGSAKNDFKDALVAWENSNNEVVLNAARWEIARSVAWGLEEEPPALEDGAAILRYLQERVPPVYDPFCGGGSIPLEAQRLGPRAYGSDLNPVAVLISKALVEIPPRFAGSPPVNPKSREARAGTVKARRVSPKMCAITASGCARRRNGASAICIRSDVARWQQGNRDRLAMGADCAQPRSGCTSRIYLSPTDENEKIAKRVGIDERVQEARAGSLNQPVPERLTGGTCYGYGLTSFDKLLTPRQLVALTTFSDLVTEAREKVLQDARAAGLPDD